MLESRRCPKCHNWHHYWLSTGRARQDDDGHPLAWQTKKLAENARRDFERGSTGFAPAIGDHFGGRKRV